jgi:4'-phosphopantetheinyl transferase
LQASTTVTTVGDVSGSMDVSGPQTTGGPPSAARPDSHPRCRIWWARTHLLRPKHLRLLTPVEHLRRDEFRVAADADRFTLAAVLLRVAGAAETGTDATLLRVDRTCPRCRRQHGRPRLPGLDLHVSVSHSGDVVAVAVTAAGPVGVDVERTGPIDYRRLLDQALTPDEARTVHNGHDFFVYWTRKESALKATGEGLATPMTDVGVTAPDAPARLIRYGAGPAPAATMTDLNGAGDEYAAAGTVLGPRPVRIEEDDAGPLLAG